MNDRNALWGDLLRRGNAGDGAAYARFLTAALPVLRNIARARLSGGTAEEVEDVVQEALLAIHAKRHTWRETEPVTPWLYAIARYKCADAARRRRARGGHGGADVPIEDLAEVLPDEALGEITAARDLGQLLDRIDTRAADIVRSVGVAGESAGEVGARLGMTEGAVRVAYHRAMQRLKALADETNMQPGRDPDRQQLTGQEAETAVGRRR
ncbi:RNA polymerase sigma-70 factor, ECF subfamily [Pseudooceanicola antarcticus]|uniref:RNA polymerase sigma-70 factor, ECF subfamily n=1 Tax=Pseudooceanicola antarcticus TaxID=1247613 RepID=A0A285ISR2_9RHOB|nr:sigma-70 family RNA polymerase sigma factor [Pseudooceanicola antarcticus]PJE31921.1 RNA polymerase subunit sigma-70 [Pseudooceanicola antarcticus]SNY50853.1 RNA polymerase sigma-70 factor, ECF subfamily [Pseudooceanicola antarcticus]